MSNSELMTTKEVAAALHVSVRQIARRVENGTLKPSFKFPGEKGGFLFDPNYIEALAEQSTHNALAGTPESQGE